MDLIGHRPKLPAPSASYTYTFKSYSICICHFFFSPTTNNWKWDCTFYESCIIVIARRCWRAISVFLYALVRGCSVEMNGYINLWVNLTYFSKSQRIHALCHLYLYVAVRAFYSGTLELIQSFVLASLECVCCGAVLFPYGTHFWSVRVCVWCCCTSTTHATRNRHIDAHTHTNTHGH